MFEAFAEAGGNFVDTACNYTDGESEEIVGALVEPDRDHFVVATKYTLSGRRDDPNAKRARLTLGPVGCFRDGRGSLTSSSRH